MDRKILICRYVNTSFTRHFNILFSPRAIITTILR